MSARIRPIVRRARNPIALGIEHSPIADVLARVLARIDRERAQQQRTEPPTAA